MLHKYIFCKFRQTVKSDVRWESRQPCGQANSPSHLLIITKYYIYIIIYIYIYLFTRLDRISVQNLPNMFLEHHWTAAPFRCMWGRQAGRAGRRASRPGKRAGRPAGRRAGRGGPAGQWAGRRAPHSTVSRQELASLFYGPPVRHV